MTDDLSLAPFRIHTVDDGSHQLWLFDGDMEEVADVFEDRDAESNGHGWESFARWLLEAEMPDSAERIWFGSESGTFVAGSSDRTALRRLAERLHTAFHDRPLLARLVTEAELD
ncbi:Imm51 family immunity protein [Actinoplanes sichuanensis]|uniref:Imm51 family immunity protein n=1 Tax=Actinoplanes sichuanensis TaxID=512349 RepID=A0ABW4AW31_9ACTN|nr:Imm51 family immunity protein [Actinoplanes sichuanensis]